MLTFAQCEEKLAKRDRKKLENNTYLEKLDDSTFGVRLHSTYVVKVHKNGNYTLDSGGWQTPTTKDRITNYSPARIHQSRGIWYFRDGSTFSDGCRVKPTGELVGKKPSTAKVEAKKRKLDRLVSGYIKGFLAHLVKEGKLTPPSNGDCWGCLFVPVGEKQTEDVRGGFRGPAPAAVKDQEVMGLDHLLSHFEEKYYVPSLLWKAIKEQGYGEPSVAWHMIDSDLKAGRKDVGMARRALTRYFTRHKPLLLELI